MRKHNFNAGPAALPRSVIEQAAADLPDHDGVGISILEMSHRSKAFQAVIDDARATLTRLYALPESHEVLFLQGGASLQFAMVPMNLGSGGAYVNTGVWSKKALAEARVIGDAHEVWSSADAGFTSVPGPDVKLEVPEDAPYLHYTSNNTIYGTQYHHVPDVNVPLVCDMSSDFLSRPIDVRPFDLIYAGAQKNAGPSGVTVLIGNKSITRGFRGGDGVPKILRYVTHAEKGSLFHTPNTFGIYLIGLVARWVEAQGGLAGVAAINARKAGRLYGAIDSRDDVFSGHAERDSRSHMNVTFRTREDAQTQAFLDAATRQDMVGLKGHRSVGGLRASIYNAVPEASVELLSRMVEDFQA